MFSIHKLSFTIFIVTCCEASSLNSWPNLTQRYDTMLNNIMNINKKRMSALQTMLHLQNHDVGTAPLRARERNVLPEKHGLLLVNYDRNSRNPTKGMSNYKHHVPKLFDEPYAFKRLINQYLQTKNKYHESYNDDRSQYDLYKSRQYHVNPLKQSKKVIVEDSVTNSDSSDDYIRMATDNEAVKHGTRELDLNFGAEEEEYDVPDIFKQLDLTLEESHMLRKNWKGSCDKKAKKVCTSACKEAVSKYCSSYSCKHGKKDFFKKECKNSCKREFGNGNKKKKSGSDE